EHVPPWIRAARRRVLGTLRARAQYPVFVKLRLLWWKSRPLLWWRISRRGDRLIRQSGARIGAARRRILVYCPEAYLREHFLALQILARVLAKAGHEVLVSHCAALFDRCVAKDSVSL